MKLALEHVLFPLIWLTYHLNPNEKRGRLLAPFHYFNPTEGSVEFHLERISGWQYGSLRLETNPPRLILSRKDGCRLEHDLVKEAASVMEIAMPGAFVLHREGLPPFVLCRCAAFHAVQFIAVWNRLPPDIRTRLRIPPAEKSAS